MQQSSFSPEYTWSPTRLWANINKPLEKQILSASAKPQCYFSFNKCIETIIMLCRLAVPGLHDLLGSRNNWSCWEKTSFGHGYFSPLFFLIFIFSPWFPHELKKGHLVRSQGRGCLLLCISYWTTNPGFAAQKWLNSVLGRREVKLCWGKKVIQPQENIPRQESRAGLEEETFNSFLVVGDSGTSCSSVWACLSPSLFCLFTAKAIESGGAGRALGAQPSWDLQGQWGHKMELAVVAGPLLVAGPTLVSSSWLW